MANGEFSQTIVIYVKEPNGSSRDGKKYIKTEITISKDISTSHQTQNNRIILSEDTSIGWSTEINKIMGNVLIKTEELHETS